MIRRIAVADGRSLLLGPDTSASWHDTSYLLGNESDNVSVAGDFEGSVAYADAVELVRLGYGTIEGEGIFRDARLAKAIFDWDATKEIEGLSDLLSPFRPRRGLDVGCGYGRLLVPMSARGFVLDGLDESGALLSSLAREIDRSECALFEGAMESFRSPGRYGYAYAAMNSMRYIETEVGVHRHLRSMAVNVEPGGLYAFQLTVAPDPEVGYRRSWQFQWSGSAHEVEWTQTSYCHVRQLIIETVTIRRVADGRLVHSEKQTQRFYSASYLRGLIARHSGAWELTACFDSNFLPVNPSDQIAGNYWFVLRRL